MKLEKVFSAEFPKSLEYADRTELEKSVNGGTAQKVDTYSNGPKAGKVKKVYMAAN